MPLINIFPLLRPPLKRGRREEIRKPFANNVSKSLAKIEIRKKTFFPQVPSKSGTSAVMPSVLSGVLSTPFFFGPVLSHLCSSFHRCLSPGLFQPIFLLYVFSPSDAFYLIFSPQVCSSQGTSSQFFLRFSLSLSLLYCSMIRVIFTSSVQLSYYANKLVSKGKPRNNV